MKWVAAAALVFLLVAPGLGAAAEDDADMPDRTKLGEFVPSSQPFAAPTISLTDSDGRKGRVGHRIFAGFPGQPPRQLAP